MCCIMRRNTGPRTRPADSGAGWNGLTAADSPPVGGLPSRPDPRIQSGTQRSKVPPVSGRDLPAPYYVEPAALPSPAGSGRCGAKSCRCGAKSCRYLPENVGNEIDSAAVRSASFRGSHKKRRQASKPRTKPSVPAFFRASEGWAAGTWGPERNVPR